MKMCRQFLLVLGAAVSVNFFTPPIAQAVEDLERAKESSNRINIAGRQRMLSQRMAKGMCFALMGVDAENQRKIALDAVDTFELSHEALQTGSEVLGLRPETDAEILAALAEVEELGRPLSVSVRQVLEGDPHTVPIRMVVELTVPTLNRMHETVGIIEKANSHGALSEEVAKTLNVAGRQRMLSQKIAKHACFVGIDLGRELSLPRLRWTINEFEDAMGWLLNGDVDENVAPPPTRKVADQLALVQKHWLSVKPLIEAIEKDHTISRDKLEVLAAGLDVVLIEMNRAVTFWVDAVG